MYILIPYDISNDKRRRKVEKILSSYGNRVNYSVFEIETTKARFRKIIKALELNTNPKEDHIRIYILGKESLKNSFVLHSNSGIFENEELYI